jgi:hypothetical protein
LRSVAGVQGGVLGTERVGTQARHLAPAAARLPGAAPDVTTIVAAGPARRRATTWLVLGIVIVAFGLRAATAQSDAVTADEPRWMERSATFHQAVRFSHFESASATTIVIGDAATMPGVTTMWVGAAAQSVWTLGQKVGVLPDADGPFATDPVGLDVAQTAMALVVALTIGGLVWLAALWAGPTAAATAGLLVATEPFFVAHGALLHTDELMALLGMAALVATALALGLPHRTAVAGRWWVGALAGGLWGLSLLTKLTALVFLPTVVLLGAWAAWAAARAGDTVASGPVRALAGPARAACWWLAAAAAVVVIAYPALWVALGHELAAVRQTMGLASTGHQQFFLGQAVATPGPTFYAVVLPLRMTPWFLVSTVVAGVAVWRRATRPYALAVVAMVAPALAVLSVASKQFDRYGLPLLVGAALVVGLAVDAVVRSAAGRLPSSARPGRRAGAAAVAATALSAALVLHSAAVVPWGLAYYDTALGGGERAVDTVLVGWGEGIEQAGPIIAARERGNCQHVTIRVPGPQSRFPCGVITTKPDATYVVVYVNQRQRRPDQFAGYAHGRDLVATVRVRGITYVELYGPRWADTVRRA